MQKIYLKYDEYTPPVECDYGFVKEMLYLGFLYPLKKKNYKMYYIMLLTEVAVSALIMTFIPFKLGILLTVAMLFLINPVWYICRDNTMVAVPGPPPVKIYGSLKKDMYH